MFYKERQADGIVFVCLLPHVIFETSDDKISGEKMKEGMNKKDRRIGLQREMRSSRTMKWKRRKKTRNSRKSRPKM